MIFVRTKRITKNGKTYTYLVRQASVRVDGKVKSIYLGRADEPSVPAMLHDEYMDAFNEKAASEKTAVTATPAEAEPPGQTEATVGETSAEPGQGAS